MNTPRALVERLRAATGPDRELDRDIHAELDGWEKVWNDELEFFQLWKNEKWIGLGSIPTYTASSVDASLALVDRLQPIGPMVAHELNHSLARDGEEFWNFRIKVYSYEEGEKPQVHWGTAHTAPLAILTCLLTALSEPNHE